jgi:asparagine N-glycosylation enzyme membrane subunit Stt3
MVLLLENLVRILFFRGSPERILYARKRFILALCAAMAASAMVQFLVYGDHTVFVILRVFAELTLFMLWVVLLTAKVARLRLASMMMVLCFISVIADLATLLAGTLSPVAWRNGVGIAVGLLASYGVANVVAWALRKPLQIGVLHFAGYVLAVTLLDQSFRGLYNTMVGG